MPRSLSILVTLLLLMGVTSTSLADPGDSTGVGAESQTSTVRVQNPSQICLRIAQANLLDQKTGWVRPSPDYKDGSWLRDSYWVTSVLGSEIGQRSLEQFGSRLSTEGQAPTRINKWGIADQYWDDESTLLYLIWAERDGGQPRERLAQAWDWISRHVAPDGAYWTPPGAGHTWHDTLAFPDWDVSTYNQGLYCVAAMSAVRLGLGYPEQVEKAISFYQRLYRPTLGYMPVSLNLDYHDVSAMVGETLARTQYGTKLLPDPLVRTTVKAMSSANFAPLGHAGLKVLSRADGGYLAAGAFWPYSYEGRYQNGGSWLFYDTMAWTALGLAGDETGFQLAAQRVRLETFTGTYYEYVSTGPAAELDRLPMNPDYGWNAFITKIVPD